MQEEQNLINKVLKISWLLCVTVFQKSQVCTRNSDGESPQTVWRGTPETAGRRPLPPPEPTVHPEGGGGEGGGGRKWWVFRKRKGGVE